MKSYTLIASGRSAIQAMLLRFCAHGSPGQPLIEKGFSQSLFALCLAHWLTKGGAKLDANQLANALEQLSACNASAARQALEDATIDFGDILGKDGKLVLAKDGKPERELIGVKEYWKKLSPTAATVDTSKLGF